MITTDIDLTKPLWWEDDIDLAVEKYLTPAPPKMPLPKVVFRYSLPVLGGIGCVLLLFMLDLGAAVLWILFLLPFFLGGLIVLLSDMDCD